MAAAALALAGVLSLKVVALLQLQGHPLLQPATGLDATTYVQLARGVMQGNLTSAPGLYFASPVYIYFLALVLWLMDSILSVRIVQIVLGTAAVALVFRTAEIWHGRRAAWFAGTLAALTGLLTFHELLVLETAVDPFLTGFAAYLLAGALSKPDDVRRRFPAALAGFGLGIQSLNRPHALIAGAGVVLVLFGAGRRRMALLLAAGLVVSLLPVLARNYIVAKDLAPASSHGGVNFYIGNNASADGTPRMVNGMAPTMAARREDARALAEKAIGRRLDDSEVSAHFYGLGWKWILSHRGDAARLFVRKLAYVFNANGPAINYGYPYYSRDERNVLRYLAVGPWLLVPLGLSGLWFAAPPDAGKRRAFWLWASLIPLYAVSIAAFFVSTPNKLPLLVLLCVPAGGALDALANMTMLPVRRLAGPVLVLAVLALFSNWRFGFDDGRREERTRMALWLIGQGRYDEAEAHVAAVEPGHLEPAALHFRIGRALIARRQIEPAIRHLERATALDPAAAGMDLALGQALLEARRPREAIPHLRRALDAGVRPDLAGLDLARAHAAAGDRANALRVLQGVRPGRPDDGARWRALGELALELQAPRLAEGFLRQATRVQPDSAENLEQLGLAIALSGRYDEATTVFEQAVHLDPRDASAQLNLAVAYAETGRVDDARRHAQEALRLEPGYERAKQLLGAMAAGRSKPR